LGKGGISHRVNRCPTGCPGIKGIPDRWDGTDSITCTPDEYDDGVSWISHVVDYDVASRLRGNERYLVDYIRTE
jgi:hypothetical protein